MDFSGMIKALFGTCSEKNTYNTAVRYKQMVFLWASQPDRRTANEIFLDLLRNQH